MNCTKIMLRFACLAVLGSMLALTTGCSSFHSDWKAAAAKPVTANELQGRWEGTWLSDMNGHTGKLRCIVSPEADGRYRFQYWASYWKIFRATYTVHFGVQQTAGVYSFSGEEDLGKLWGMFELGAHEFHGSAAGSNFNANYKSKLDHGTFKMTRP
jgi:hypothetical protein